MGGVGGFMSMKPQGLLSLLGGFGGGSNGPSSAGDPSQSPFINPISSGVPNWNMTGQPSNGSSLIQKMLGYLQNRPSL
jgi:hypothetical protein